MKKYLLFIIILILGELNAQQTIRGNVVDLESKYPLPGVNVVVISDTTQLLGAATDMYGNFKIENVSYGRQELRITYLGYNTQYVTTIVNSAKEVVLNIKLEESSTMMDEVVISSSNGNDVKNEMQLSVHKFFR